MLDETTIKGRIVSSAMKLAAERPWGGVSLIEIADKAGLTLADIRTHFDGKPAIVRGFVRAVDDALLTQARKPAADSGARDALFEVVMARFDLLMPYKPALRSILKDAEPDLAMLGAAMSSQQWMLSAAGIESSGARGSVRTLGLASVYASVFRTWLEDDDPGMARTMAALDRRLRRGERNIQAVEGVCDTASGLARRLGELFASSPLGRRPEKKSPAADFNPAAGDSG
jgi:ubiquinone biosynthesis protein COQ9